MKTRILPLLLIAAMAFSTACNNDDNDQPVPTLTQTEIDYINRYTQANLAQQSLSQLALDSGTNAAIPAYTQAGLQQYRNAQLSLDSIAQQYSLVLPTTPDSATVNFRNTLLGTARGRSFDSLYVQNQLLLLDNYLIELNNATTQTNNTRLRTYIDLQRPLIQQQRINTDSLRLSL